MDTSILELGTERFTVVHATVDAGQFSSRRVASEPVPLGDSVRSEGVIGRRSWAEAMRVLGRLVARAQRASRAGSVVGVAPFALGKAHDADAFVSAVRRRFGIGVMLLGDAESDNLRHRAVRAELRDWIAPLGQIHLGDPAIEVVAGREGAVEFSTRLPFGVASLHAAFADRDDTLSPSDAGALFSLIRLSAGPTARQVGAFEGLSLCVTSENANAVRDVARCWGYLDAESPAIGRLALHALVPELVAAGPAALADCGVDPGCARKVATTAVTMDALCDLLSMRGVRFAEHGVAEGAALDVLHPKSALRRSTG